jgi:undecaprenyl-diphosphatase
VQSNTSKGPFSEVLYVMIWLGFIALFIIAKNPPIQFDIQVSDAFRNPGSSIFNDLMNGASLLGETWPSIFLATIVTIWFWIKGLRRQALWFVMALIVVSSTTSMIKDIVDRTRPDGNAFSFISGHTSYFTVFGGYLMFNVQTLVNSNRLVIIWRSGLVVAVAIIAMSRIYLGVHWPTDVLGGFLWGLIVLLPMQWAVDSRQQITA